MFIFNLSLLNLFQSLLVENDDPLLKQSVFQSEGIIPTAILVDIHLTNLFLF